MLTVRTVPELVQQTARYTVGHSACQNIPVGYAWTVQMTDTQ